MGFFDVIAPIMAGISAASSLFGFGKDLFGTEYDRQLDYQKQAMNYQSQLQAGLMDKSQGFTRENMATSQQYNLENMAKQQEYAQLNMQNQFAYNQALSNAARNAFQLRSAGVNPVNGVSSASSVGLPAAGLPSAPSGTSPSGAVGMASFTPSKTIESLNSMQFARVAQQNALDAAIADKQSAEAENVRTLMYANLDLIKSQIEANMKAAGKSQAEIDTLLKNLGWIDKLNENAIDVSQKNASATMEQAKAASKNADTNQYSAETQRLSYELQKMKFERYDMALLQPTINNLNAMAREHNQQANLLQEDVKWYYEKVMADLDIKKQVEEQARQEAARTGKDVENYEFKMYSQFALSLIDTVGNLIPTKQIGNGIAAALRGIGGKSANRAANAFESDYKSVGTIDAHEYNTPDSFNREQNRRANEEFRRNHPEIFGSD